MFGFGSGTKRARLVQVNMVKIQTQSENASGLKNKPNQWLVDVRIRIKYDRTCTEGGY